MFLQGVQIGEPHLICIKAGSGEAITEHQEGLVLKDSQQGHLREGMAEGERHQNKGRHWLYSVEIPPENDNLRGNGAHVKMQEPESEPPEGQGGIFNLRKLCSCPLKIFMNLFGWNIFIYSLFFKILAHWC